MLLEGQRCVSSSARACVLTLMNGLTTGGHSISKTSDNCLQMYCIRSENENDCCHLYTVSLPGPFLHHMSTFCCVLWHLGAELLICVHSNECSTHFKNLLIAPGPVLLFILVSVSHRHYTTLDCEQVMTLWFGSSLVILCVASCDCGLAWNTFNDSVFIMGFKLNTCST